MIQTSNRQSTASEAPMFSEHRSKMVLKVGMTADVDCLRYEKELFPTEYKVYQLLQDQGRLFRIFKGWVAASVSDTWGIIFSYD